MNAAWNMLALNSPLLRALQPALARARWPTQAWPSMLEYQALLDECGVYTARGERLRVVPAAPVSAEKACESYERRVYMLAELATRAENWHDCFNLLTWTAFPLAKAALNARHISLSDVHGARTQGHRLPAQDALTQFDESGVILAYSDATLANMVRGFQWKQLFWDKRMQAKANLSCFLFGHGLMEKALSPYTGMTGKALLIPVDPAFMKWSLARQIAQLDGLVADFIGSAACWPNARALMPLPILGIPGFFAENENAEYYDNVAYFRAGRLVRPD